MAVVITGNNTPTAGGVTYGDGTTYANTAAGSSGQALLSNGVSAPTWGTPTASTATTATNLAGGSAGAVPYQSGAGATGFSAAGTSGQVLTSAGTSAPTWTTPSSVGALVFINSQTVSSPVSVVDITSGFSSTYDDYLILFENIVAATTSINFGFRIYKNSALITSTTYRYQRTSSSGTTGANQFSITANTSDFGTADTTNFTFGEIRVFNANSTSASFLSRTGNVGAVSGALWQVAMTNTAANSFTGLRIYDPAGNNISSGTFRLYGVAKS